MNHHLNKVNDDGVVPLVNGAEIAVIRRVDIAGESCHPRSRQPTTKSKTTERTTKYNNAFAIVVVALCFHYLLSAVEAQQQIPTQRLHETKRSTSTYDSERMATSTITSTTPQTETTTPHPTSKHLRDALSARRFKQEEPEDENNNNQMSSNTIKDAPESCFYSELMETNTTTHRVPPTTGMVFYIGSKQTPLTIEGMEITVDALDLNKKYDWRIRVYASEGNYNENAWDASAISFIKIADTTALLHPDRQRVLIPAHAFQSLVLDRLQRRFLYIHAAGPWLQYTLQAFTKPREQAISDHPLLVVFSGSPLPLKSSDGGDSVGSEDIVEDPLAMTLTTSVPFDDPSQEFPNELDTTIATVFSGKFHLSVKKAVCEEEQDPNFVPPPLVVETELEFLHVVSETLAATDYSKIQDAVNAQVNVLLTSDVALSELVKMHNVALLDSSKAFFRSFAGQCPWTMCNFLVVKLTIQHDDTVSPGLIQSLFFAHAISTFSQQAILPNLPATVTGENMGFATVRAQFELTLSGVPAEQKSMDSVQLDFLIQQLIDFLNANLEILYSQVLTINIEKQDFVQNTKRQRQQRQRRKLGGEDNGHRGLAEPPNLGSLTLSGTLTGGNIAAQASSEFANRISEVLKDAEHVEMLLSILQYNANLPGVMRHNTRYQGFTHLQSMEGSLADAVYTGSNDVNNIGSGSPNDQNEESDGWYASLQERGILKIVGIVGGALFICVVAVMWYFMRPARALKRKSPRHQPSKFDHNQGRRPSGQQPMSRPDPSVAGRSGVPSEGPTTNDSDNDNNNNIPRTKHLKKSKSMGDVDDSTSFDTTLQDSMNLSIRSLDTDDFTGSRKKRKGRKVNYSNHDLMGPADNPDDPQGQDATVPPRGPSDSDKADDNNNNNNISRTKHFKKSKSMGDLDDARSLDTTLQDSMNFSIQSLDTDDITGARKKRKKRKKVKRSDDNLMGPTDNPDHPQGRDTTVPRQGRKSRPVAGAPLPRASTPDPIHVGASATPVQPSVSKAETKPPNEQLKDTTNRRKGSGACVPLSAIQRQEHGSVAHPLDIPVRSNRSSPIDGQSSKGKVPLARQNSFQRESATYGMSNPSHSAVHLQRARSQQPSPRQPLPAPLPPPPKRSSTGSQGPGAPTQESTSYPLHPPAKGQSESSQCGVQPPPPPPPPPTRYPEGPQGPRAPTTPSCDCSPLKNGGLRRGSMANAVLVNEHAKPHYTRRELEDMTMKDLKSLLPAGDGQFSSVDKTNLIEHLICSGAVGVMLSYKLSALRDMSAGQLRKCLSYAHVSFDSRYVVEKEDMIRVFYASGKLRLVPETD